MTAEIPEEARAAARAARYGEPVDTYTWDRVADAVLEAAAPILAEARGVARPGIRTGTSSVPMRPAGFRGGKGIMERFPPAGKPA